MAGLLLRRGDTLLPRLAYYYRKMAALPRPWRRQLRRKLAVTVSGAALLLALAGPALPPALADADAPAATITVVNGEVAITNNNKCSLMEAIINARATTNGQMKADCTSGNINGPDTVSLPNGGDFVLTAPHNEQNGPTGLPVITTSMTIEGHGATIRRSTATGTPHFRIMDVDAGATLTLRDTTIRDGWASPDYDDGPGGGIVSRGNLIIENSTIADNYGSYKGGGIYAAGQLTITGSSVTNNWVGGSAAAGGGIFANGQTNITDSTIADNRASADDITAHGGGLYIGPDAQATISGSLINQNTASSDYDTAGAGIFVYGQATIVDSTIAENINGGNEGGGTGGGVYVTGQATISGSTIRDNVVHAFYEGYSYDLHPAYGGGLHNDGTTLVVNSTISGNTAGYGGGVVNTHEGNLTIWHTTITDNHAIQEVADYDEAGGSGGGLFSGPHYQGENCSATTLRGVIISGNTSDISAKQALFVPPTPGYCSASITVNAFNVFGQGGSSGLVGFTPGATDIVPSAGLNAILSPLADNGGPTMTHALPQGSPALDRAPNASCTAAPVNGVDQRGEPRNQNGAGNVTNNECDAGSFERQAGGGGGAAFLVSPSGSGTVGGVAFAPSDILKYDPATGWSMYFDGSDLEITKNLSAFEVLDNGDILMAFAARQTLPGLGGMTPHSLARFTPTTTGPNTAGSFTLAFNGSMNYLTTSGEKIDAVADLGNGWTAISTTGGAAVKLPNGATLKGQDEDALANNLWTHEWTPYFDGTPIPGLKAEDVNALWVDPANGDLYISILGGFNLSGVSGNGRDIVKLTNNGGGSYTPSLWWNGAAAGFPVNVDGVEILP